MTILNKKLVFGEGPKDCKIAFVGEAPGSQEEIFGRPFVGPAGKLLDQLLINSGISRCSCYITNVIKERPPGNNIKVFLDLSKKDPTKTPRYGDYLKYQQQLKEELEDCKANVIVAVGGVSFYALNTLREITKRRGSILESTLITGRKVIPIIHPSGALRNYIWRHFISHDLLRVKEESQSPKIDLPKRNILIGMDFRRAISCLTYSEGFVGSVAVDIEVMRDEVSCISFAPAANEAVSVPFTKKGQHYFDPEQEAEVWIKIAEILENPRITKVFQNAAFDIQFLFEKYGIRTWPIEDTMIGHAILFPDLPKGLDFITSTLTKEPYYKDEGKKYLKMPTSDENFWIYNAKDSAVCIEAWPQIERDLKITGAWESYRRQVELVPSLVYMQNRGMRLDIEGLKKLSEETAVEIEEAIKELRKIIGYEINHQSSQQVKDYFYKTLGLKPYVNRTTGNPTCDDNALKRLDRRGFKEAKILRKIRSLSKLKGTYLDADFDTDSRIRGSFNPVGNKFLRLSSSKTIFGTGVNMQNLHPKMNQFILADEGYLLYNLDLSKADNTVVAYIAPDANMIRAFEKDIDLHRMTASLIFQKPLEEISDEPGSCSIGSGEFSERFWGKKANHGLNYGLSFRKFAFLYEISENDAKFIVDRYHQAYSGIHQYHTWVQEALRRNRRLVDCLGKPYLFMDRWGDELFREAYSYIPQSTVAGKLHRDGFIYIYNNPDLFEKVELLNNIHDSIVFQIPLSTPLKRHAEMILKIKASLESPLHWRGREFIIKVDMQVGHNKGNLKDLKETEVSNLTTEIERKTDEITIWRKVECLDKLRTGLRDG